MATVALVEQLLALLLEYAPKMISQVNLVLTLLKSGQDPTPEQQAQIDEALVESQKVLQEAINRRLALSQGSADGSGPDQPSSLP